MCNPAALTARYLEVLNDRLGWGATLEDDGTLMFCLSEMQPTGFFNAWLDNHAPHDPEYLRVHTGILLEPDDCIDQQWLVSLAARLTRAFRMVQLTVEGGVLLLAVEMLAAGPGCLPDPDHLAAILPRVRDSLVGAAIRFDEYVALKGIEVATLAAEEQGGTDR